MKGFCYAVRVPKQVPEFPEGVRKFFQQCGAEGGRISGKRKKGSAEMRRISKIRWAKVRAAKVAKPSK